MTRPLLALLGLIALAAGLLVISATHEHPEDERPAPWDEYEPQLWEL